MHPAVEAQILKRIIEPTVRGMAAEGMPYRGFLYAGLMIDKTGEPSIIEYNCRFGDPETQPILMRLRSDLSSHCLAAMDGALCNEQADWDPRPALGVVLASKGYPGDYAKGDVIRGLGTKVNDTVVFHAGTIEKGDQVVTNGGRVLCVTSLGDDIQAAQAGAYDAIRHLKWANMMFRGDIGWRAVNR